MTSPRFRSRHLHATFYKQFIVDMSDLGWTTGAINFGAAPITIIDYQPEDRQETIKKNTVAVSLGNYGADEDEELGATGGGLRSALYNIFIDVYMAEQALAIAVCDDIRDIYTDLSMPLINQINGVPEPNTLIEVDTILGPERPGGGAGSDTFRKHWRVMRVDGRLFYQS
jgi:hypothetical protein